MQHNYCGIYENLTIRPLHREDIESLRQWRNDKELSKFLTPIPEITKEMQEHWYDRYLEDKDTVFFSIVDQGKQKMIGSVALYDFKGDSCEVGKIVVGDNGERGKGFGYSALLLAMNVGVRKMNIRHFRIKVCEDNVVACHIYKKVAFKEVERHPFVGGGVEISMEITDEEFINNNSRCKEMKVFEE